MFALTEAWSRLCRYHRGCVTISVSFLASMNAHSGHCCTALSNFSAEQTMVKWNERDLGEDINLSLWWEKQVFFFCLFFAETLEHHQPCSWQPKQVFYAKTGSSLNSDEVFLVAWPNHIMSPALSWTGNRKRNLRNAKFQHIYGLHKRTLPMFIPAIELHQYYHVSDSSIISACNAKGAVQYNKSRRKGLKTTFDLLNVHRFPFKWGYRGFFPSSSFKFFLYRQKAEA